MADKPGLGRVMGRALLGPLNLTLVAGAAAGGALLQSWAVLAVGGVAYAALVAHDLVSAEFWRKVQRETPRKRLQLPEELRDVETRLAAEALHRASNEVDRVFAQTPPQVREHVTYALVAIVELRERAHALLARAEALSLYLASVDVAGARASASQIDARAQGTRDEEARAKYELARAASHERLAALEDIAKARERVFASLTHIAATMDGVATKMVRMRVLDEQAQDELGGDMKEELSRMNVELKAFEETLEALVEIA